MKKICSGWLFSGFAIFLSLSFMNCEEEYGGVRRNVFSCNNGVTLLACPQGFLIRSSGIESHARTRAISTIQNQQGYLVQTKDIVEFFFPDDSILSAWLDADCQGQ